MAEVEMSDATTAAAGDANPAAAPAAAPAAKGKQAEGEGKKRFEVKKVGRRRPCDDDDDDDLLPRSPAARRALSVAGCLSPKRLSLLTC
jgi:hypothetical protein